MPESETRPAAKSFLREHPAFGFLWCARAAAGLAFQMQAVAVGWQIYALTRSTFELGLVGLAQFVPMVVLTLPAGHAADRYDRRAIGLLALAAQGLAAGFLAVGSWGHWIGVPGIFAAVTVIGAARAFERPATQALMPTLVPKPLVPKAVAWGSGAFQTASIIGPAIGGILYAFGPQVAYAAAGGLALVGAGFMGALRRRGAEAPREPATLETIFAGIGFIRSQPIILGSISLDLFAVLLGGATALLPAFAQILGVGVRGLGALRAAPAVGSMAVSAYLARHPLERRAGRRMFSAVLVFGAATIVFGLSKSFVLSLASLAVLGGADVVSVVVRSSLVQLRTPDAMRGRVSAVNALFIGTSNQLGEFESGVTASLLHTVPATVLGGGGTIVVALLWMRLFPELRRYDQVLARPD
jgi:MFS family permease